jgi:hypothetical protein
MAQSTPIYPDILSFARAHVKCVDDAEVHVKLRGFLRQAPGFTQARPGFVESASGEQVTVAWFEAYCKGDGKGAKEWQAHQKRLDDEAKKLLEASVSVQARHKISSVAAEKKVCYHDGHYTHGFLAPHRMPMDEWTYRMVGCHMGLWECKKEEPPPKKKESSWLGGI